MGGVREVVCEGKSRGGARAGQHGEGSGRGEEKRALFGRQVRNEGGATRARVEEVLAAAWMTTHETQGSRLPR
eukprot:2202687-Rhodomonas_salina.2